MLANSPMFLFNIQKKNKSKEAIKKTYWASPKDQIKSIRNFKTFWQESTFAGSVRTSFRNAKNIWPIVCFTYVL